MEGLLSRARLRPYLAVAGGDTQNGLLLYTWNALDPAQDRGGPRERRPGANGGDPRQGDR